MNETEFWILVGRGQHPIQPIKKEPTQSGNWRHGRPVEPPGEILVYELSSQYAGTPKVFYYECAIPLMREDMIDVLQKSGVANLECFPALLKDPETGTEYKNYQAINIVGLVSCLDRQNSKVMSHSNGLNSDADFEALFIDEKKAQGHLLFRLAENVSAIVVHESVRAALINAQIPGIVFFGPGEWSG
jgi:hypothetical protein